MVNVSNEEIVFLDSCSLNLEDLKDICAQYDIGQLKCIHKHFEKTANINILIESEKGKYVAKFFFVKPDRFLNVIRYMENIQKNNVPVILPLHDKNKDYLIHVKEYHVQLTPYISACPFRYTSKHMLSSGQTLKRIHTALKDDFDISEPAASVYPSTNVFIESITRMEALRGGIADNYISIVNNLYPRIVDKWEEQAKGLPITIIHGDWKASNQLFTKDGDVCAVLDFDYAQRKERLYDIAYALYTFSKHWNDPITRAFIEGYGALTEHEIEIQHLAVARISFFFLCTASFENNAATAINQEIEKQVPIIENVLSDCGRARLIELCDVHK